MSNSSKLDFGTAGRFVHAGMLTLVDDYQHVLGNTQAGHLREEINTIVSSHGIPFELFFELSLSYFPKCGKWVDKLLSSSPQGAEKMFYEEDMPFDDRWPFGNMPFVDTILGCSGTNLRPKYGLGTLVDNHALGEINPDLIFLLRQILSFAKKFEVKWKEGSDVVSAEDFWFCRIGNLCSQVD